MDDVKKNGYGKQEKSGRNLLGGSGGGSGSSFTSNGSVNWVD